MRVCACVLLPPCIGPCTFVSVIVRHSLLGAAELFFCACLLLLGLLLGFHAKPAGNESEVPQ